MKPYKLTYDPVKNVRNILRRGLGFQQVAALDFETATLLIDDRNQYGETRYIAIAYLHKRLHVACFVERDDGIRVISFRKANNREANKYGKPLYFDG